MYCFVGFRYVEIELSGKDGFERYEIIELGFLYFDIFWYDFVIVGEVKNFLIVKGSDWYYYIIFI